MLRGTLRVDEAPCADVRRFVRTALLTDGQADLLLPLRDVALIAIQGDSVTLTGYEAVPSVTNGVLYQQSWLIRVLSRQEFDDWHRIERGRPSHARQQPGATTATAAETPARA